MISLNSPGFEDVLLESLLGISNSEGGIDWREDFSLLIRKLIDGDWKEIESLITLKFLKIPF